MEYVVKSKKEEIKKFEIVGTNGFSIFPNYEDINEVIIFDSKLIENIINLKFLKKYKQFLTMLYYLLNNDESTDSDVVMALNEISKYRHLFIMKYQKYLEKEKVEKYLKKIKYIESELNKKLVSFNLDSKNKGR